MMSANSRIRFGLQIVFVCLYITRSHYHHCTNFICRHWTYKMPVRYNLSSVWVRLSLFSQLSIRQYVGLCVFSLLVFFVMIEIIYIHFSYYHLQTGSMTYYPLFRVRSWNNGMRCMSFYILMNHKLRPRQPTGLLPDTKICGLRRHQEWRERFTHHCRLAIPTCITARAWRTCRDACRER